MFRFHEQKHPFHFFIHPFSILREKTSRNKKIKARPLFIRLRLCISACAPVCSLSNLFEIKFFLLVFLTVLYNYLCNHVYTVKGWSAVEVSWLLLCYSNFFCSFLNQFLWLPIISSLFSVFTASSRISDQNTTEPRSVWETRTPEGPPQSPIRFQLYLEARGAMTCNVKQI